MQAKYPKFDQKIQEHINANKMKSSHTRPGTIMEYDRVNNTATILLDDQHSDGIGNIIRLVPCPAVRGVQVVSPTSGTRCVVGFRTKEETSPYVINFFDDTAARSNSIINAHAVTGIPKFLVH